MRYLQCAVCTSTLKTTEF